jgi:hypothetical protein
MEEGVAGQQKGKTHNAGLGTPELDVGGIVTPHPAGREEQPPDHIGNVEKDPTHGERLEERLVCTVSSISKVITRAAMMTR